RRARATSARGGAEPVYFSVHSATARLAPEGGALIHLGWYVGDDAPDAKTVEHRLEGVLDRLQPGWRDLIVERRFLPRMTVVSALATAATGGLSGRPDAAGPAAARPVPRRRLGGVRRLARRLEPDEWPARRAAGGRACAPARRRGRMRRQ